MGIHLGERIGVGATAEIYQYNDNQVIKLFYEDRTEVAVREEYECLAAVQELGLNVPKLGELVLIDNRHGFIMEFLKGYDMINGLLSSNNDPVKLIQEFTKMQYAMHQKSNKNLRSGKEWLSNRISWTDALTEEAKTQLYEYLKLLPEGEAICHNDLHPGNVIVTEEGFYIIDWCDVTSGCALMDVARTLLVFQVDSLPPECSEEMKAISQAKSMLGKLYEAEYSKLSGVTEEEMYAWIPVVAASRLFCESKEVKPALLELVTKGLHKRIS